MEQLDDTVKPLLAARDRIDAAIQGYLDKVALLRKRREALQTAVDLIRMGDDEIMKLPTMAPPSNGANKRVVVFDVDAVESAVVMYLKDEWRSKPEIEDHLRRSGNTFSHAGITRILKTCPRIRRRGEREQTRYTSD